MPKRKDPPKQAKSAAIYARVSSQEQSDEGYSIDSQLRFAREYCARLGMRIHREYIEAETAKRAGRREFGAMVAAARAGEFDCIVVEKTDRLYRNIKDRVSIGELEMDLHFVKENVVLTPTSRSHEKFVHDMKVVVAKLYVDQLGEEASKGMAEKAKQGVWPSYAPIGYANVTRDGRKVIEPDGMAPIVASVFEQYAAGEFSLKEAAGWAYRMGLRTKKDGRVLKASIYLMLNNPVYCGLIRWNGSVYAGIHRPIISQALYDRAQDVMHGRKNNRGGYNTSDFLYKGIFRCGHCGCMITAEIKKGKYLYYHCTGMRGPCPGKRAVTEQSLTRQIATALEGLRLAPEILTWLKQALRESFAEERAFHDEQTSRLQREEKRLRKALERLYLDKVSGEVPSSTYEDLRHRWEGELAEIEVGLKAFGAAQRSYFDEGVMLIELASNAHLRFEQGTGEQKRKLLRHLASNFEIEGGMIRLELRNSFKLMLGANRLAPENGAEKANLEIWLPVINALRDELAA